MKETYNGKDLKTTYNSLSEKYNVVDIDDDCYGCSKGQGNTAEEAIEKCIQICKACRETLIVIFKETNVPDIIRIDGKEYSIKEE